MAVNEVLLVSEEKIKAFTTINENVSPQLLIPHILNAQNTYLVNLLGSTFLKDIYLQVRTNSVTVLNKYLLDEYIGPVVLNYGLMMAIPFLNYKILNKSIMVPKSETAENIDLDEVKYLVTEVRNVADQYAMLLQRYLFYHMNDYPLWNTANMRDGVLPDKGSPFISPLTVPHYPYAWKKRLFTQAARGQYGYTLQGSIGQVGQQGALCDFPWWIWGY